MTKWENSPGPPAKRPWWRRQKRMRSLCKSWRSSWRSEWAPRSHWTGSWSLVCKPARQLGLQNRVEGGTQGPGPNPTCNRGLISSCVHAASGLPFAQWIWEAGGRGGWRGPPLQAVGTAGALRPHCLPGSRGTPAGTSWCAVQWTPPRPMRTFSTPSKQLRTPPTRPPARPSLRSRWAPALGPFLFVCTEKYKQALL